jgi:hypothetical protein
MFADPNVIAEDTGGAETTNSWARILPVAGQKGTVYTNSSRANGEPAFIRISHSKVGKGVNARTRSLISQESYQWDDAGEEMTSGVPLVKFQLVVDLPDAVTDANLASALFERSCEQFTGLIRGNGENGASGIIMANFFDKFLAGEA